MALCITDEPLIVSGHRAPPAPLNITFGARGEPVQLRSENHFPSVMLSLTHTSQIGPKRGDWEATLAAGEAAFAREQAPPG